MKRASIAATASLAALALLPAAPAGAGAPPGPKLPDLVISSFGLSSWGTCAPGKTVFTFQVTVKNIGAGAMPVSEPLLLVHDLKSSPAQDWGVGQGETYSLAPGASHTYAVHMGYYTQNPAFMTTAAPHPFVAVVNPKHTLPESNFNNNEGPGPATYQGHHVIMVGAPKGCPKP
ncbi:MAG TPA: CARDB domain-containing protein [Caulobacteraceae bacterium]|jgi:hypothetical protein|nr:CARDB domain-containing protein [Caulobacteraceae bacterium]